MIHHSKKLIAAEVGQEELRKVTNALKGRNNRRVTISEVVRESLRNTLAGIKKDADAVAFLKSARINDTSQGLRVDIE